MRVSRTILIAALVLMFSANLLAEPQISGLVDLVYRNIDADDYSNVTFKKQSNFHSVRARLFFDAPVADNSAVFTQILIDDQIFALYGAYLRLSRLAGPHVNLHIGYIPSTVGSFGPRTYSNMNPLIGTPLLYNYHSNFVPGTDDAIRTVDAFLAERGNRSIYGLPLLYDNCWNTGVELYGSAGKLDYSVGLLSGAVSAPTVQQAKDIPQVTTHLSWQFSPGLIVGASAFFGPYLSESSYGDVLPSGKKHSEYMNSGIGYELYYGSGPFEFHSETFCAAWEHPYLPKLTLTAGYGEAKYKFLPGWYVAGRFDFFEPGKLTDSNGGKEFWDYPVKRYEYGIGYRPNRQTIIKLVNQINAVDQTDELDSEIYAVQVSVVF